MNPTRRASGASPKAGPSTTSPTARDTRARPSSGSSAAPPRGAHPSTSSRGTGTAASAKRWRPGWTVLVLDGEWSVSPNDHMDPHPPRARFPPPARRGLVDIPAMTRDWLCVTDPPLVGYQRRIYEAVKKAGNNGIHSERLFDLLYSHDPDGGPDFKSLAVNIWQLNRKLKPHGVKVFAGRGGDRVYRFISI